MPAAPFHGKVFWDGGGGEEWAEQDGGQAEERKDQAGRGGGGRDPNPHASWAAQHGSPQPTQ